MEEPRGATAPGGGGAARLGVATRRLETPVMEQRPPDLVM